MKSIEQRLKIIEEIISEIHACIVLGRPAVSDDTLYHRAIKALVEGDKAPMALYLRGHNGEVPKFELGTDLKSVPRTGRG